MEYRMGLECREDGDDRYISGLALPWDEEIRNSIQHESWAPGSARVELPLPLRYGHLGDPTAVPVPIGTIVEARDTDAGLWIEARLMPTDVSAQAWHAVRDGLVRGMSVEFLRSETQPPKPMGRSLWRIESSSIKGVALTENPAYKGTNVLARARRPRLEELGAWLAQRGR